MKPPPFSYHVPGTVAEAVGLLATLENAKLLAGGQSLMPMLNMRFVLPDHVIDLNRVPELAFIREQDGRVVIGAMTRQRDLEFSPLIRAKCPILVEALQHVGHRQTRNRGTIGGSLCHLDPSAELATCALALDVTVTAASQRGERTIAFADFPVGYMTPALDADEMLVALSFQAWPQGHGYGFAEFARRHGDFALASAAALLTVEGERVTRVAVALGGVAAVPVRATALEEALLGQAATPAVFRAAAETCRSIEAMDDVHAPASYRQHLAVVMAGRALAAAHARCQSGKG